MVYNPNIHHRRSVRLHGYDYSQQGAYFVTICTADRECLFGEIANAEMLLNDFGKIIFDEWAKTPEKRPNVELGEFVVMPNHFHAIITITHQDENPRRGVLNTPYENCNTPDPSKRQSPSKTIGAIVRGFKASVSKQIGFSCWQRGFHEHIIRDEKAFRSISEYIMANPAKWQEDTFYR